MTALAIMVLGTASHAGKSLIAAGLCRALARSGVRVAPFKAQNMSNNAAVTEDGGEIGRAQALQARACGLAPHSTMNPVLLKPTGRHTAQIVVRGRVRTEATAAAYRDLAPALWTEAAACYDELSSRHDVIVLEGAGSCAELNITWDFANLRAARHAEADCLLVGDIDRGGIFAQLLGTLDLLAPADRSLIRATIINKFRGDRALLDTAIATIEKRSGIPVAGVLPHLDGLLLDEEDSVGIPSSSASPHGEEARGKDVIEIAVLRLPCISNFTDVTALQREPDVRLRFIDVMRGDPVCGADVIILPGSKNTFADLAKLREAGYETRLRAALEAGSEIVGFCGGMQMMGRRLLDPHGVEAGGGVDGLGWLPIETEWAPEKITRSVRGRHLGLDAAFSGYEIHCGRSTAIDVPVLVRSEDGQALGYGDERVWGTYVHGLFDTAEMRHAWLARLRARRGLPPCLERSPYSIDSELDRLADAIREHLALPEPWHELVRAAA